MMSNKKTFQVDYEIIEEFNNLPNELQELIQKTIDVLPRAYAPYSNFHVSAGLLLSNDEILVNVNQENIAFPVGICAERAVLSMIDGLHDFNKTKIKALVIAFEKQGNVSKGPEFISPCGMCRQAILEYEFRNEAVFPIFMLHQHFNSAIKVSSIRSLLPFSFDRM
ncbi:MAG TPA: cytidine deaminase [Chitinophagaceae bacterium]|nr:cytidine deaminase [Chitinophagaceae bacterium]